MVLILEDLTKSSTDEDVNLRISLWNSKHKKNLALDSCPTATGIVKLSVIACRSFVT